MRLSRYYTGERWRVIASLCHNVTTAVIWLLHLSALILPYGFPAFSSPVSFISSPTISSRDCSFQPCLFFYSQSHTSSPVFSFTPSPILPALSFLVTPSPILPALSFVIVHGFKLSKSSLDLSLVTIYCHSELRIQCVKNDAATLRRFHIAGRNATGRYETRRDAASPDDETRWYTRRRAMVGWRLVSYRAEKYWHPKRNVNKACG